MGVVLAGGAATRFGGDKLAELYGGRPLLHHAVLALMGVCDEVLVVTAPGRSPGLPAGARLVHDPEPRAGPLAGLIAALEASEAPVALVAGGDMPALSGAVLREMLDDLHETGAGAVALAEDDDVRPLPCAVRREALAEGRHLVGEGERSLRALLRAIGVRGMPEDTWRALDPEGRTLFDVDEPADLET